MSDLQESISIAGYPTELGVEVKELTEEAAHLHLPFKDENSNPGKALHGGVAASMINIGGLAVARSSLGEEAERIHTAAIQVTYLSAAIGESIEAKARLLRRGKEICFVETMVQTEGGKPIAAGLSTVRGRFGAEESEPVATRGDDGGSDPGMMGPILAGTVPFIGRLGLKVENMSGGTARIKMPFTERNGNGSGGVHEGPILALLDTTGAMGAWAVTGPGNYKASTVGIQAGMVAATKEEDLVAYSRVAQRDREIFWSEVEVASCADQRVVARGTVLYRIVIPKK